ncbi:MAG TPA: PhzF family phenazine biosynthesis protein [Candidatus Cybelea sp.]|nr:PhzF family phenazine biosynthesis protein [Candidatus Cybelea sp.]
MKIPFYQIDAFARRTFAGNPAGVCVLERWLEDRTMLAIAAEKNLPATAFLVPGDAASAIRWFAPAGELELCGHATLASGYVVLNVLRPDRSRVDFDSAAGRLEVQRDRDRFALDFPAMPPEQQHDPDLVTHAIGLRPAELWEAAGGRGMAVLAEASQVLDLRPDMAAVAALPFSALVVTAPGFENDCDFVSRYFAPKHGIAEDFVTGSAHCVLVPYWAQALRKPQLFARQLSSRGGELWVEDLGARVRIAASAQRSPKER